MGSQTLAIHAGEGVRHGVGVSVGAPICRTSTFTFSSTAEMKLWAEGKSKAYIYTRYGNPTLAIVEKKIAAMEGAEAAVVTASGMAAISGALIGTLQQGDELISTAQTYGGTYRLMRDMFPGMGIKVHHVGVDFGCIRRMAVARSDDGSSNVTRRRSLRRNPAARLRVNTLNRTSLARTIRRWLPRLLFPLFCRLWCRSLRSFMLM